LAKREDEKAKQKADDKSFQQFWQKKNQELVKKNWSYGILRFFLGRSRDC